MSHPSADLNLLFGIMAVQNDLISRDQLIEAMGLWVLDKKKPLGEVLVERGALSEERRKLIDALVREHIKQHGGADRSLAAISPAPELQQVLAGVPDADVQASLARVPAYGDLPPTMTMGQSTSSGGRFQILRPHARGGLGQVFVAYDKELHREVALKEIHSENARHPEAQARFVLEAEITGGLEHPGIVPVYGLGHHDDGRPFYAMRFIRGDSLKEAVDRFYRDSEPGTAGGGQPGATPADVTSQRNLQFRKLLGRFLDVCHAVEYAHSRGVLHRDLKPGNVMIGKYGETLVVDWGLAKAQGRADETAAGEAPLRPASGSGQTPTQAGKAVGTPQFMSPEQAAGRLDQLGARSDVYSLGATLYYLLTGRPPFEKNEDHGAILRAVQGGDFPRPRAIVRDVPAPLEAICLTAMAVRPDDRYASAAKLAEDIEHWLADEPVAAHPDGLAARVGRWTRRHKPVVTAAAALLVTAVVALSTSLVAIERARQRTVAAERERALDQVEALLVAKPSAVPTLIAAISPFRQWVDPRLRELLARDLSPAQARRVRLALLPVDPQQAGPLGDFLLDAEPDELLVVRDALRPQGAQLAERLWATVEDRQAAPARRLRAAGALAAYEPDDARWKRYARDLGRLLVAENSLRLGDWKALFEPVRAHLSPELLAVVSDRSASAADQENAANLGADFAAGDPVALVELATVVPARQFGELVERLRESGATGLPALDASLDAEPTPHWADKPLDPAWVPVSHVSVEAIERAGGVVDDRSAFCQTMPIDEFFKVAEALLLSGYRPRRARPYETRQGLLVAAVWERDGKNWRFVSGVNDDEIRRSDEVFRGKGLELCDITAGPVANRNGVSPMQYFGLWVQRKPPDPPSQFLLGLSPTEHDRLAAALRLADFAPFACAVHGYGDDRRISSLWSATPAGTEFEIITDRSAPGGLSSSHTIMDIALSGVPFDEIEPPISSSGGGHLEAAERAVHERPDDTRAGYDLARLYDAGGDRARALEQYTRVIDKDDVRRAESLYRRALLHARAGRQHEAEQDLVDFSVATLADELWRNRKLALSAVIGAHFGDARAIRPLEEAVNSNPQAGALRLQAARAYALLYDLAADKSDWVAQSYVKRLVELIDDAIEHTADTLSVSLSGVEFRTVRELPEFRRAASRLPPARYVACAAIARSDIRLKTRFSEVLRPGEHLAWCRQLQKSGGRPRSIATVVVPTPLPDEPEAICVRSLWVEPQIDEADKDELAQRQAQAAIALLALGHEERVWPLLRHTDDPRLRTYLIHLFAPLKFPAAVLSERLAVETDVTSRRAVLLALGEYAADQLPADVRGGLLEQCRRMFRDDPDAGVHSAAEWVLLRLGDDDGADRATADLATLPPDAGKGWRVNSQKMTMVTIPDPASAAGAFEIASKEVTVGQFQRFLAQHGGLAYLDTARFSVIRQRLSDEPVRNLNWYEAAQYCRWLSEQEGVPEDQMCYPSVSEIRDGFTPVADWNRRTGYRLPSEDEWLVACRAGAVARRFYGNDDKLLDKYAWYLGNAEGNVSRVARLKPNDFGLFDILGNVAEFAGVPEPRGSFLTLGGNTLTAGWRLNDNPRWLTTSSRVRGHEGLRVARTVVAGVDRITRSADEGRIEIALGGRGERFVVAEEKGVIGVLPHEGRLPVHLAVPLAKAAAREFSLTIRRPDGGEDLHVNQVVADDWSVRFFPIRESRPTVTDDVWQAGLSGNSYVVREHQRLDFNWPGVPVEGIPADWFGLRATTDIELLGGRYEVRTTADDGVRLSIDGMQVIDNWKGQLPTTTAVVRRLAPGKHRFALDFYEGGVSAVLRFGIRRIEDDPALVNCDWKVRFFEIKEQQIVPSDELWLQTISQPPLDEWRLAELDLTAAERLKENLPADWLAIMAESEVDLPEGSYEIRALADDGVRVYVDERKVIDAWRADPPLAESARLNLTAGRHRLRVDFYEVTHGLTLKIETRRLDVRLPNGRKAPKQ
jgi:hypothetical protein